MATEYSKTKMEVSTKAHGSTTRDVASESKSIRTETLMRANGRMTSIAARGN